MKFLVLILSVVFSQAASASFVEICDLSGIVVSQGVLQTPTAELPYFNQEIVMKVESVTDKGGHTSCKGFLGEAKLQVSSAALLDLATLQPGENIDVAYRHFSSFSPNGVVSSESAQLIGPAQKVLSAVLSDEAVSKAVSKLKADIGLGIADEPVEHLFTNVQHVPGGICGIIACSNEYVVTLTYGHEFMNGPKESLVIKAHSYLPGILNEDSVQITILQNVEEASSI